MTASKTIHDVLHDLQVALKVPKDLWNDFGKYPYRNAESILQAVKPLLPEGYCVLVDIAPETVGDRLVCRATASLVGPESSVGVDAYAVEPEGKKGMDSAQVSGATISYAKKYALGNLLAIDGNRDSDAETPSSGTQAKKGNGARKRAARPAEGDTEPLATVVEDERLAEAKRALFRAMQAYAERHGREVAEIVDATFSAKPADEWTVADFEARAYEFAGA